MNNCSVFKLQSSVDVVAPKFGYIPFLVTESADLYIRYKANGSVYIIESNGSYFTVDSGSEHKTEASLTANVETVLHVNTTHGCTICIDRNKISGVSAFHSNINMDDIYGSSFKYLLNKQSSGTYGNIINIINGQELDTFTFSSSLVTGEIKEFVEKAFQEECTYKSPYCLVNVINAQSQISFNGINYSSFYIKEENSLIKVATDENFTNILGSYNGTNWV